MTFDLHFSKMQALGNDYVYVETLTQTVKNPETLAVRLSDRHFGVGSDGMILICPSECADFRMRVFDPDGTEAEMCGNGLRSVGKYVYDKGFTKKTVFTVETLGGIKTVYLDLRDGKTASVTADIGKPVMEAEKLPALCGLSRCIDFPIFLDGRRFFVTALSFGNPHAVCFLENEPVETFDLARYGTLLEHHALFPKRVNAEFCQVIDRKTLSLRTWERGTGETLACATGSAACVVSGVMTGRCERRAVVRQIGGETLVEWNDSGNVFLTAPSVHVFDGTIRLDKEVFGA